MIDLNIDTIKSHSQMIHYFGLGFIQVKLNKRERLHFYTPELEKIIDHEEVHNHRYSFHSYILKGEFYQEIYNLVEGNDYICELESCSVDPNKKPPSNTSRLCDIQISNLSSYKTGSDYWIDADTFHTVSAKKCITMISRGTPHKEFAEVVRPVNSKKVCPFSKQVSKDKMWQIVASMLEEQF